MRKTAKILMANIKGNIAKYVLLVVVFALSFMSLVVSLDFKEITYNAVWNALEESACNIHLNVKTKNKEEPCFDYMPAENVLKDNSKVQTYTLVITTGGTLKENNKSVMGMKKNDFGNVNIKLLNESSERHENGAYISKNFSGLNNYKIGDELAVECSNGKTLNIIVDGIVDDTQIILQNNEPILVDFDYLGKFLDKEGKASTIFVKAVSMSAIDELYNDITLALSDYNMNIKKVFNPSESTFYLEPVTVALSIFSIFAMLTTIFLCYFIYKSLILSRTKQIAAFKSLGISKRELYITALAESVILILTASLIGVVLSTILMAILSRLLTGVVVYSLSLNSCLLVFLILSVLCCACVLLTHKNILSKNVIELIKGNSNSSTGNDSNQKNIISALIYGICFAALSGLFTVGLLIKNEIWDIVAISCGIVLMAMVAYFFIKILCILLQKLSYKRKFLFMQTDANLKLNKGIIFIIVLIMSLTTATSTLSDTLSATLSTYYANVDVFLTTSNEEKADQYLDKEKYNISDIYKCYIATQNIDDVTMYIMGVDSNDYQKYSQDAFVTKNANDMLKDLDETENGVIISTTLANSWKVKSGEKIRLLTTSGEKDFVIVGLVNSFDNGGNNIIISQKHFKNNFVLQDAFYYLTFNEEADIEKFIMPFYKEHKNIFTMTIKPMRNLIQNNNNQINQIFTAVYMLAAILIAVAILNIIFNVMINVKINFRRYAIRYTLGESKKRISINILSEYAILLFISSIIAIFGMGGLNYFIFDLLNRTVGYFTYKYSVSIFSIITVFVVYAISMAVPITEFKGINIIENIKGDENQ